MVSLDETVVSSLTHESNTISQLAACLSINGPLCEVKDFKEFGWAEILNKVLQQLYLFLGFCLEEVLEAVVLCCQTHLSTYWQ